MKNNRILKVGERLLSAPKGKYKFSKVLGKFVEVSTMSDDYEQQLESEAENEGMTIQYGFCVDDSFTCSKSEDLTKVSSVDDSFTWEQYDEWVSKGDRKEVYSKSKKDHTGFIEQVENNELSKDEIVKYLKENL